MKIAFRPWFIKFNGESWLADLPWTGQVWATRQVVLDSVKQ